LLLLLLLLLSESPPQVPQEPVQFQKPRKPPHQDSLLPRIGRSDGLTNSYNEYLQSMRENIHSGRVSLRVKEVVSRPDEQK
jgi:hypothetical protein